VFVVDGQQPTAKKVANGSLSLRNTRRMSSCESETYAELAKTDQRSLSAWIRIACQEKARRESART
jgi:hypothetical protein